MYLHAYIHPKLWLHSWWDLIEIQLNDWLIDWSIDWLFECPFIYILQLWRWRSMTSNQLSNIDNTKPHLFYFDKNLK